MSVIKTWTTVALLSLAFAVALATFSYAVLIYAQPAETKMKLVHAGQGNATNIVFAFIPQNMEIKAGESITWDNPNFYAEPHSVSFLNENKIFSRVCSAI